MSCPDCFSGKVHDGTPTGREEIVHGLKTYIADPPEGKKPEGIIVILPDAYGVDFVNNQLLADHYAIMGNYRVYLPDLMEGHTVPVWSLEVIPKVMATNSVWAWLTKPYHIALAMYALLPFLYHNRIPVSQPRVATFMTEARAEADALKIPVGAAGFCWGGSHAIVLAQSTEGVLTKGTRPLVDAAFTAHPSFSVVPADFEKVKIPLSIAIGDLDMAMPLKEIEKIKAAFDKLEVPTEVKIYPGARHGFGVRADYDNPNTEKQSHEAEEQAISWFKRHFSEVKF